MSETDKIPPRDLASEINLLGAIIIDPEIIDNVFVGMRAEYFYKESHQLIFYGMKKIYNAGDAIDYITLSNELSSRKKLETAGGLTYLTSLTKNIAGGYNYGYYMASIIDKYVRREYIKACNESIKRNFDESTDIADNISNLNTTLTKIQETFSGIQRGRNIKELANNSIDKYFERKQLNSTGGVIGVNTGLSKLNEVTGGWQKGDSILLAGRTSMGKTAMALHFAQSAFFNGKKVQFFSYEMTAEKLADRIMISLSKVSPDGFKYGNLLSEDEQQLEDAIDLLKDAGCYIDDNSSQNIDQVFSKCRIAQKHGECDLVIIDYISLIPPLEKRQVREQEVSDISKRIKKYAKELNIPVITLVQVNRASETSSTKRPKLSELRESGALEQDADVVIFVYRPEYYSIKEFKYRKYKSSINDYSEETISSKDMGLLIVAKQRNGKTGDIYFSHSHGMNVISEFKEQEPEYIPQSRYEADKPF